MSALTNRPTLESVRTTPIDEIAKLPPEHLSLLQEDADAALDAAKQLKDWIAGAIALRYGDRASATRRAVGKDTGTVRFEDGDVTVIADLPKRVEWDQAQLAALVERIRATGDDPAEYIDISFRVAERKFSAWPEAIRKAFEPARTVKAGKQSISLVLAEDAR
ncbi:MAG: hypothetical protein AB7O88_22050 [Reyranellaceae bacterium]